MPQVFHPATNSISRFTIFGAVFFIAGGLWLGVIYNRSAYVTGVDVAREQPVPFSHAHHVGGLGIDCRYCHTSVEVSASAGMPSTDTCMNCHSQIWADSPMLAPVRESWANNEPLEWVRVHDLADHVYFNHAIHVDRGVQCATCHGPVDRMPLVWKAESLQMEWCLECHRHPESQLETAASFDLNAAQLTDCSVCHR